ncbi:MAG: nuclear transport factor 2 family protein, partial [Terriglobales bacterium]
MSQPQAPADVVRAVAAGVSRLLGGNLSPIEREEQLDRLAAFYARRTDVRHPFAPLGDSPMYTRDELRHHFATTTHSRDVESFDATGIVVHHTADPEVVIIEFRYEGSACGRAFEMPCIFVVRVRDGVIVESRDYGHHLA